MSDNLIAARDAAQTALDQIVSTRSTVFAKGQENHDAITAIEEERKRLLIVAKATGDADAQARLARIAETLAGLQTERDELRDALALIDADVTQAREALADASQAVRDAGIHDMKLKRIELAKQIDAGLAMVATAFPEYVGLGESLVALQQYDVFAMKSFNVIRAAIPKCFDEITGGQIIRPGWSRSLEESERRQWAIPAAA